ncbi:MAG: T9SS type A sorting domain-containing protein [Ferruginibacter sp.]
MLSSFFYTASGNIADGNRVVFDAQYSNAIDGNDAIKLINPGENFGLLRDTRILAVEARQPIANGDTLFYNMTHLVSQQYRLDIVPQNLAGTTVSCELIDRYLNSRKTLSLNDTNHIAVEITSDPASRAVNRLMVVFSTAIVAAQPFEFLNISAINVDNKLVGINWKVSHEMEIVQYNVERSTDNVYYSNLAFSLPANNDHDAGNYEYRDTKPFNGENYYRVRSTDRTGRSTYSDEVKVNFAGPKPTMSIYPNPLVNRSFQLQLSQLLPGKYFIKLTNNSGQQVYSAPLQITGINFIQTISLGSNIGRGNYHLSIWSGNGIVNAQEIVVP